MGRAFLPLSVCASVLFYTLVHYCIHVCTYACTFECTANCDSKKYIQVNNGCYRFQHLKLLIIHTLEIAMLTIYLVIFFKDPSYKGITAVFSFLLVGCHLYRKGETFNNL